MLARKSIQTKKHINNKKKQQHHQKEKIAPTKISIKKHDVIFDLGHLRTLLESDKFMTTVPQYINKFFFRYGDDIFFDKGDDFELLKRVDARARIPSNFAKTIKITNENGKEYSKKIDLSSYFGHELFLSTPEARVVIDYKNDNYKYIETEYIKGFGVEYNYLNMKKDLPRDYTRKIVETDFVQKGVDMFFNHVKEVLCSGYEHEYETVVRFLASSCAGHKVKFCLVLQTFKEQAGKGSVLNFMAELLGKRMHKTSSCEEVVKFSKNFEGRTLINLDEVPVAGSIKEFQDVMKSLITENTFNCRAMHKQGYQQQNTFNVIFCSNNNCVLLTQSNNARYYVPTCSDKYAGNVHKPYFDKLHKYLKNEDVKVAIFQEFMRIYEEEVKPIDWRTPTNNVTEAGKLKIIEALPKIIKFIKNDYLFKGHDIDETCSGLLDEYKRKYPSDNPHPNVFGYNLGLLNITAKRIQNKTFNGRKYIMDYATLKQEFIKKNWLVDEELEELEIMEENKGITPKPSTKRLCDILDHDCQQNDEDEEIKIDYEQLYKQQLDKLKALEKEMTELKSNSIILAKPPNVEPLLNSIKKFKNIVLPAKEDEYIDEEDIDDLLSMIRAN